MKDAFHFISTVAVFLWLFVFMAGCEEKRSQDTSKLSPVSDGNWSGMFVAEFDGHKFIVLKGGGYPPQHFIHHPDCQCGKGDKIKP